MVRLAVDAASEWVRGPHANASAPAHSSAMATRDGESEEEDMNPGSEQRERVGPKPAIGQSDPPRIEAGRNLTKRVTNGQHEE